MKKQTIIGIALMTLAVLGYIILMQTFFAPDPAAIQARKEQQKQAQMAKEAEEAAQATVATAPTLAKDLRIVDENIAAEQVVLETERIKAVFTNEGGRLLSFKLKKETDNGTPLELLPQGADYPAFGMSIGDDKGMLMTKPMKVKTYEADGKKHIAFMSTLEANGAPLSLTKTFSFAPDEYLFTLSVELKNSKNEAIALGDGSYAYTIDTGRELGPVLGGSKDNRSFFVYNNGKTHTVKASKKSAYDAGAISWNSIRGQYFMLAILPGAAPYTYGYHAQGAKDAPEHRITIARPAISSSVQNDRLSIYMGPLHKAELARYDNANENSFGISGAYLSKAIKSGWLGWLEWLLKIMLDFFYKFVHNYGIAIILVTVAIKILTYPLTKKSYDSMARMKELQPQLQAIQEKYPNNKQKIQEEQMKLYREEQVSPLGGCLPLLIQMPILIAFYTVIGSYFPIRGAIFIPGWITDLSSPESLFAFNFALPFLGVDGMTHIRLLPFIYTASMFLSTKFANPGGADATGGMNTKFMQYGFPLIFFFMFYNMSSGLLVYWLFTNIFTILQQLLTNHLHQKPEYIAKQKAKREARKIAQKAKASQRAQAMQRARRK